MDGSSTYARVSHLLLAGCSDSTHGWVNSAELKKAGGEWPPQLMWLSPFYETFDEQLTEEIKEFCREDFHE